MLDHAFTVSLTQCFGFSIIPLPSLLFSNTPFRVQIGPGCFFRGHVRDIVCETANTEHERMTINGLGVLGAVWTLGLEMNGLGVSRDTRGLGMFGCF